MTLCDNKKECHDLETIGEDNNAIRVYCKNCGAQERIGKDKNGNPNNYQVGIWFRKDFVQPPHPLFYKYGGKSGMSVV